MDHSQVSHSTGDVAVPGMLEQLARELSVLYGNQRKLRSADQTYKPLARQGRWQDTWLRVAKLCVQHNLKPIDVITTGFRLFSPYPYPTHFLSRRVINELTHPKQRNLTTHLVQRRYRTEVEELALMLGRGYSLSEALNHPAYTATPLFRQTTARRAGLHELAAAWQSAADFQRLIELPAYIELCDSPDGRSDASA